MDVDEDPEEEQQYPAGGPLFHPQMEAVVDSDEDDGVGSFDEESDDDYPTVRQSPCWTFSYQMRDQDPDTRHSHLFNSPTMADMTFILYDGTRGDRYQKPLFGHSFVLLPASNFFRMNYAGRPCYIPIDYISYKHFHGVIKMVYCGWDEKAIPLSEVADYYRLIRHLGLQDMFQWHVRTWLMKSVCHYHVDNIASIFIASYENQFSDLMRECLGEMADYPSKILKDRNLRKIPLRAMIGWLERRYTNATRKQLRKAVKRWMAANTRSPDEEGKQKLQHLVNTVPYKHRGKRLMLQTAPGVALSYVRCDDEYILGWAEHRVDLPLIDEDHEYTIRASFDIMFDATVKVYGLSMVFVPHKHHDIRNDEIDLYGEVEICVNGNQINWAQFDRTINFQQQEYVIVECFFMRSVLDYDQRYTVRLYWQTIGAYPDVLTFDTPQSYVKTFGNCFINSIWYEPIISY